MSDKTAAKYGKQIVRENRKLLWVKLGQMRVSALAQREFKQYWADHLLANFDLNKFGTPEVSYRDGYFWIVSGQHRIDALKRWEGKNWRELNIECWVYNGLTEEQEAEIFLSLSDTLNIDSFQKFKVALRVNRQPEIEIACIVHNQNLVISRTEMPGAIYAVGTLKKLYKTIGPQCLGSALAIIRDAYGDAGFSSRVIMGIGFLCGRYNGTIEQKQIIESLVRAHGGLNGLLNKAEGLHLKSGNSKAQCVAAVAVDIINQSRKGKNKLPSWFKE